MGLLSREALTRMPMVRGDKNPKISKNSILRDRVNDEQVKLVKRGPMMIRNPKKAAKGV